MTNIFFHRVSFLVSLTVFGVVTNTLSVHAETMENMTAAVGEDISQPMSIPVSITNPSEVKAELKSNPSVKIQVINLPSSPSVEIKQPQLETIHAAEISPYMASEWIATENSAPVIKNSAADLMINSATSQTTTQTQSNPQPKIEIAQSDIELARSGNETFSYIGLGGNVGFTGNTALGEGNLAIISKIGIKKNISLRPSAILGNNTAFLIPVTYDFKLQTADPFERLPLLPYLGAGISVSTNDDVGLLLTAGIDVPFSPKFTATAALNTSFKNQTDVGLLLGVGYNFKGF